MPCLLWVNVVSGICARVRHQLSRFNGYARVFATGERTNCIAAKQGCVCVRVCEWEFMLASVQLEFCALF
jgi:hypothetical protein